MKFIKDNMNKKMILLMLIPIAIIFQYYLFKFGVIKPLVKGVEIQVIDGDYIRDIDKYVMKLDDTVTLSAGNFIMVPSYAKESDIWFNVLDDSGVLEIKDNKMTALKEGFSSIAVMKDSRVLKKATIRVVSQSVEHMEVELSNNINYVGDSATITSIIDVDYEFKEKPKVIYESSNENIIRVEDGVVKAVGVGSATLYVKSLDEEQIIRFNDIQARVSSIDISDKEIEVKQTIKLNPMIHTSPPNLKHPFIEYEIYEQDKGVIKLDNNGNIQGIKEGSQKIKVRCGYVEKIINITVVKESISNKIINNLKAIFEQVDEILKIELSWDYLEDVDEYNIYTKDNLEDEDFKLFESLDKEDYIKDKSKIKKEIDLNIDKENYDISICVTGVNSRSESKASNIVNIKSENNIIDDMKVENLTSSIDEELGVINLNWDKIKDIECSYDIYIKDNLKEESGFMLYEYGVLENEISIDIKEYPLDIEIYVVAKYKDKYSQKSEILSIKLDQEVEESE